MLDIGRAAGPEIETGTNPAFRRAQTDLAAVRAYWEGLRAEGAIPPRSAIDPRGLGAALDRVFLAERIGKGLARVRLAGNVLNELAGMELRGLPLSCLFTAEARPDLGRVTQRIFEGPGTARLHLTSGRELGRPALDGHLLLLPLRDDDGACALLLGCLCVGDGIGRAPRRFGITGIVEEPLRVDLLTPAAPQRATGSPVAAPARAHLRLVHSADWDRSRTTGGGPAAT